MFVPTGMPSPPPGVSTVACSTSSWIYVAGFTTPASLNGFYAPYYSAAQAPSALQACTNANYGISGTGAAWAAAFNTSWQATGHPIGYYNTAGGVGSASNTFWVRDYYNPTGLFAGNTQSFWNLVAGACPLNVMTFRAGRRPCKMPDPRAAA